jgi:hypothetical protein
MSRSQRALSAVFDGIPIAPAPATARRARIFIITSPRPRTGKTFLATLLTDFLTTDNGKVRAFDVNPGEEALSDFRLTVTRKVDIGAVEDQVALFDNLIVDDGIGKVVDVGHTSHERFFTLIEDIRLIDEARRHGLEFTLLFAADPHPASPQSYRKFQQRFPDVALVPVFNEAILQGQKIREQYPFSRPTAIPLQIAVLPPALKVLADRSGCSFAEFHTQLPVALPMGPAIELRSWTKRAFLEFRELELRFLLEKLRASLSS